MSGDRDLAPRVAAGGEPSSGATLPDDSPDDWRELAVLTALADEVRAHLAHRDFDGRSVLLPGRPGARFAARHIAQQVLAEVDGATSPPARSGPAEPGLRRAAMTERLLILERAVHTPADE